MADTQESTRAVTPVGVLVFPALFEARSFENGPERYSAVLVFDEEAQKTAEFQNLKRAAAVAARDKFGEKPPKLRSPFRDGEDKEDVAGFGPGKVFISVTSKNKPLVVDRKKVDGKFPVITDEERLYNGCKVRASVNAFGYDRTGNRGVSFGLNNMQFVADGERLAIGGRSNPNSDFDDVEGENVSEGEANDLF
jgi:hypothetical protein